MWTAMLVCTAALVLVPPPRSVVQASGVFELRLKSFANENGKDSLGKCCSGSGSGGECSGVCRTRFRVCLKQYQVNIDTTTPCTYGDVVTPVLGDNVLNFTQAGASFANPIRFPFDFTWPGTFSLIVEAFHDNTENSTYALSGSSASDRVIITRLATQRWLDVGSEWIEDEHRSHHSMMLYEYRVTCAAYYYGKGCENLCRPRNDNFGHYRCSSTGERVCLSGWKGDYCATPHCLTGCDEQHGHCSRPNECMCHSGWTGQFCDQCVRYPGCLHGTCQKPWECLCDEGWGGLFCNQDLNFCTNHKPCRNGGTCFNTGQGSYTCACAPGFSGTDCETPLLDCQAQPCLNQGTCIPAPANISLSALALMSEDREEESLGRKYRCACPVGWRGRHCELGTRSCRDAPCARGATCEDDQERGYRCICPPGLAGPDCERQLDECAAHPCSNGGTCADHPSGFRCSCPPGFTGERCQQNVDDCQGEPCLHGATCLDLVNGFSCQCVPGYVGRLCQDKVDYCLAKPCANGGSCLSTTNDYRCSCKPGFAGKDCSVDVDECKSSPCQHGGTCRNRVNGFACECPDGWRGDTCSEASARPGSAGFWQAGRGRSAAAVAASPEARHAALTTEHVVVIATISTAVPAFVLVAALAVMCMKRRQKREQAKADEEARLQNERNAVHSSMSKRAGALLSPQLEASSMTMSPPPPPGDSHMIKNTWAAHGQTGLGDRNHGGKSVNNAMAAAVAAAAIADDGYKPEPICGVGGGGGGGCIGGSGGAPEARPRPTKQLNTEAAAHRASQHLYHKEKECGLGALGGSLGLASACQQLLEAKRASALYAGPTESGCCVVSSCAEAKRPETPPSVETQQGSDTPGCAVYVIDDHYRHDSALAATLATEV